MSDTLPMLRPDLPGFVHGIVGSDPWTVQCDGCGYTFTHASAGYAVILSDVRFDHHHPGRRLCATCRKTEGWVER